MISIRTATKNDLSFLHDVERSAAEAFRILPDHALSGNVVPMEVLAGMQEEGKLWVAVNDTDQPVGFAGCRDMDGCLYIHEISVALDFQQKGIGSRLMKAVLDYAAHHDYKAAVLTTRRDLAWNMPFYKKLGFVEAFDQSACPALFEQLQKEIQRGANLDKRCAMILSFSEK